MKVLITLGLAVFASIPGPDRGRLGANDPNLAMTWDGGAAPEATGDAAATSGGRAPQSQVRLNAATNPQLKANRPVRPCKDSADSSCDGQL